MFSWITSTFSKPPAASDKYKTLFFAGFVHPEYHYRRDAAATTVVAAADQEQQQHDQEQRQRRQHLQNEQDSDMEALVQELFTPFGDISFFAFDSSIGAGVVEYQNGKSGENCYLMSHMLPFRVEREQANAAEKTTTATSAAPLPFSLVCVEFACLLPFSATATPLALSATAWVCNRKTLDELDDYYRTKKKQQQDDSGDIKKTRAEAEFWHQHLQFMVQQQKSQRHAISESLAKLRSLLLLTDSSASSASSAAAATTTIIKLNGDVAAAVHREVAEHMKSLVVTAEARCCAMDPSKEFWGEVVIPHCVEKIIGQLCEIDSERMVIVSPSSHRQLLKDQSAAATATATNTLIRSVVHASLSILDVWFALYETFYMGEISRTQHSSPVAVLDYKLRGGGASSSASSSSIRHPAWAAFNFKFPSEEAKHNSECSAALSRRTDIAKLFATTAATVGNIKSSSDKNRNSSNSSNRNNSSDTLLHPIHLGLREWPGGVSDDAGSSLRALSAVLCAIRPLYQDTALRHLWTTTASSSSSPPVNGNSNNNTSAFLQILALAEEHLKKAFVNVSSGDAIIEGAWNLLYRGSWRMEHSFSLSAQYLREANSILNATSSSALVKRRKQQELLNKQEEAASSSSSSSSALNLVSTLQGLDMQPPLWPLIRPVDPIEVDWTRTRGVFCDVVGVYERLFDNTSGKQQQQRNEQDNINHNNRNNSNLVSVVWTALCNSVTQALLSTLGLVLMVSGQDPSFVKSRHYRRQLVRALTQLVHPVFWTVVLATAFYFALRAGYVARLQLWLYNMATTFTVEGNGEWVAWLVSGDEQQHVELQQQQQQQRQIREQVLHWV